MTTGATFFQPDSRHKHSDFTHENPTLGEFCFALMWYARDGVAQESFGHFRCYTITDNALVRVDLRTWRTIVHGLTSRPWKPMKWGWKLRIFIIQKNSNVKNRPIFEITVFGKYIFEQFREKCWASDEVNNPTLGEFCFAMVRPHAIALHKTLS